MRVLQILRGLFAKGFTVTYMFGRREKSPGGSYGILGVAFLERIPLLVS